MDFRMKLLATAAATTLLATGSHAAPIRKHRAPSANAELLQEVKALRQQVEELRARVEMTSTAQAATVAQVTSTQAQVQSVQTQVAAATAAPAVTKEEVHNQIAAAVDKEHHNDKFYFKGVTITPGGFIEAAGIYRSRFQGDDIASSFSVPFPGQSHQSQVSEGRFTARQSRISLLAQGNPDAHTVLSAYGELDFQGAAQTSNSNQSNSFVPRLRNIYATIDWNRPSYGVHILAGQNWSLLTLQGKGMTPRAEITPPQIDAQYIPGFAWARQPGARITADFLDHQLWVGFAAENAQTTFGGTGVPANIVSTLSGQNGTTSPATGSFQQFYNGAGSSLSLNTVPDFIGKVAYDSTIAGHYVHIEGFGIYRTFSTHLDGTVTSNDVHSWGYGGSVNLTLIPKILDIQFSGIGGKGIGRYGSAGLPDVTSDAAGNLHPLNEFMLLAGATLHATPKLDLYAFAGEEQEQQMLLDNGTTGLGLPTANNTGCFIETTTTATTSACAGNTHRIRQLTGGFWDKFYQGSFGRAQVGIQYSYTQRELFDGVGGEPQTSNNMAFLSFRYYPF
jgi:hypothetical protein